MKTQLLVVFAALLAYSSGVFVPPRPGHQKHLLGAKECTWGPSYWCQNLTAAAGCHAVKHCIQTVWVHKTLPPDHSSVCQICLDMVKQARDQLESNETQELIEQVFEGTCALIHLKPFVKECDKIADQYIPELIDTLASEMNPQVVCSVAGLCNNDKILAMLQGEDDKVKPKRDTCDGCHTVVEIMERKLNKMSRDQILQGFLEVCGRTGSLSDACSNIILVYFTEIYNKLKTDFNANDVCLMAGECSAKFHTHANVEITPISHIGYVEIENGQKDDLPCELCEQLVGHLRDLLIANTTVDEFKLVLQGLCKQTKSFKQECLSLVDEYYAIAYNFLVSELNSSEICSLAGICPNNKEMSVPIVPLLPVETAQKALEITPAPHKPSGLVNMAMEGSSIEILQRPEEAQLPIDILMPPHTQILYNPQVCVFCEYLLHYLQQVITSPKSEEEIKAVIDKACEKLPSSVNSTCVDFVNMYEPAMVAILAQEIDPSQVCPLIKACPSDQVKDVDVFMHQGSDGTKCPLCLFAVSKLEEMVKNDKTEDNIKNALDKLCDRLPTDLSGECEDFVKTYTKELVEMLVADLNPQEVCVYLKLCNDTAPPGDHVSFAGDVETNMIPDITVNGKLIEKEHLEDAQCVLCEFIMKQVQDELKDNKTEEAIKSTVLHICQVLPSTVKKECSDFVDEYADTIIQLLIATTVPDEICRMMHFCSKAFEKVRVEIFDCSICESVVWAMEKILDNPKIDHGVTHVLEKACRALPTKEQEKCKEMVDKYGKDIYDLVIHLANKGLVCRELGMCASKVARPRRDLTDPKPIGGDKCTWGPSHWCENEDNAQKCGEGAVKHCQEKVWKGSSPRSKRETPKPIGGNPCTWGPSHWCTTEDNAKNCGEGAVKHCQEKVWGASAPTN